MVEMDGQEANQVGQEKLFLPWNEMIENENHVMRDRVADLEKKVLEQNDEIMCLRSTLADALRRINTLEGAKTHSTGDRSGTLKDGMGVIRVRSHIGSDVRDSHKRGSSHTSLKGTNSTSSSARGARRGASHYQSTSSLYSDGHSSSSASPAPSPSPTSASNNAAGGASSRPHPSPASPFASPAHSRGTPTPQTNNSALNKRWASTSDFSTNGTTASSSSSPLHERHHAVASSKWVSSPSRDVLDPGASSAVRSLRV